MEIDVENFHNRRNDQRWNRMSVGDIIERMTWSMPDKECLVATPDATVNPKHARVTYRQAHELVNRVANGLLALSLPKAARVAMLCDNSVEAWLSKIAIAKAGLVATPMNVMMAPDIITDGLERMEASCAIVDAELWQRMGHAFEAAGVKPILSIGAGPDDDYPSFDDFIEGQGIEDPDVAIHADDVWEVLFTSGTTAKPKAVMISHAYAYMAGYNHVLSMTRGLDHENELRAATFTPMTFHIGDLLMMIAPLLAGATVIMGRKPEGHAMARACTQEGVNCLWGGSPQFVESLIQAVEDNPVAYDLSRINVMFFGWAPLAPGSLARFQRLTSPKLSVYEIIGQTECVVCHCFYINQNRDTYLRNSPAVNYVGLPLPMLASTVMDMDGNDLRGQPGVEGEAVYRSPAMFSGYYRDPEATREALKDEWLHSGDSFAYDEKGLRIMVDRYKDIVKSGGENVSSIRVESVLQQHPSIARAAVVGIPDEKWGEMVTACVIAKPGATLDEDAIIAFAREQLAGFETPKKIVPMDSFPETVGGKILKYKLRAALAETA